MGKIYNLRVKEDYIRSMAFVNYECGNGFFIVTKRLVNEFGSQEAMVIAKLLEVNRYVWEMPLEKRIGYVERLGKKAVDLVQNGYFYVKMSTISYETMLSEDFVRKILNEFMQENILDIKRGGNPARNFYKLNFFALEEILRTEPKNKSPKDIKKNRSARIITNQKRAKDGKFISGKNEEWCENSSLDVV